MFASPAPSARPFAAVSLALATLAVAPARGAAQEVGLPLGTRAPAAAVETLDGQPADVARLAQGGPTLIEFWASWCSECKALEPRIAEVARTNPTLRLVRVAVSVNQSPERVRRYVAASKLPGTVVFDRTGQATAAYDAPATSYVVLLDRTGTVAYTGQGGTQDLTAAVRKVMR